MGFPKGGKGQNGSVRSAALSVAVVGGAGHVGLPLSLMWASKGLRVVVVDRDEKKLEDLQAGKFPFLERGGPELLARSLQEKWAITYTKSLEEIKNVQVVVLTIGTPIDEHLNPAIKDVLECVDTLVPYLSNGHTLVLRSTLFPGTSERVAHVLGEKNLSGVGVAFCPERIAQGFALEELSNLPQIISGSSKSAIETSAELFTAFGVEIIEMKLQEAEVAKLFLNTWRYINFATANQFYMLATEKGLDFSKIRDACMYKYQRATNFPPAGLAAGPCLFKDTMVLASYSRNTASMCHAAMLINETMPDVLIAQAKERNAPRGLCGVRVGLLGMAFKGDNDDTRDSLSFKCRRLLQNEGAKVLCSDEYVAAEDFVPMEEAAACPVVIIACPHTAYKGMRFSPDQIVIDCWNIAGEKIPLQVRPQMKTEPLDLATSPKKRILITGSHGFIMGYVIPILLENGHEVWGVDNFWKYGELAKEFDSHPNFHFVKGDAKDSAMLQSMIETNKIQVFIAGAAIIGGIAMFHKLAYFLLSENERITCAAFDACVAAHGKGILEKIVVISSSMVYESSTTFPSAEEDLKSCPPPQSTYGFQKLACEYFAKGAWEQHGLPYTIIRPFNAVGIGEKRAAIEMEVLSGNVKLAMSHVVPDIVQKVMKGQNPLHILGSGQQKRHYTYAGDLAEGIVRCTLDPRAQNEDYNVSTPVGHTVLELSKVIWDMLNPDLPFAVTSDDPFEYDVQMRVPDVSKAERQLGITCTTSLEATLQEVIPWIKEHIKRGEI